MTGRLSWLVAGAAALAWVPFVTKPLSPDEGGFLLIASQWQPGSSLYGHYWVDRPPLLITVFDLASHLGGEVGLRLIGIAAVVVSVLLADRLARTVTQRPGCVPALIAAPFLTTPLFGTTMVNGELLAVPAVLAGILALLGAWTARGPKQLAWAVAAGVAAGTAVLLKQNVVDVFVVTSVLVVLGLRHRQWRRAAALAVGVPAGAGITLALSLMWAEERGTEPLRLWDAVVTFRGQAASVIHSSSTSSTSGRFVELLIAAALSGAPFLLVVLAMRARRAASEGSPQPDLRAPAAALLLWEVVAIGAGGSYWLHYLIGLVPGLVLLAVAAAQRPAAMRRWTSAAVAASVLSAVVATTTAAVTMPLYSADAAVASYLRSHGTTRDTVVVGFGHPNIVYASGLRSPYEQLWSLPVRVRDPRLQELTRVLEGRRAPTWVVVNGSSLATWGVDATTAQQVLDARYRRATTIGEYVVWRLSASTVR